MRMASPRIRGERGSPAPRSLHQIWRRRANRDSGAAFASIGIWSIAAEKSGDDEEFSARRMSHPGSLPSHCEISMREVFLDSRGRMWYARLVNNQVGYFYSADVPGQKLR
jgi:hypothetical protein